MIMYPEKKLRKAPLDTPLLFTFKRHIQKGQYQGRYQLKAVAKIRIVAQTGTVLNMIAMDGSDIKDRAGTWYVGFGNVLSFWFRQYPTPAGHAILNPLYLQT